MGIEGIEYGAGHARLEELLGSVDRPGNYCVGGRLYVPLPRVQVKGVGDLSFPVPPAQIEALLDAAERAPYGKGTRTLVDTSVRDCWQIDSRKVRLAGQAWPDSLAKVLSLVAKGLGLPVERLGAEPYKLLVYRRGGFFSEHRDTEKIPGMVGTLSLSLPAAGSGGEIVVRHRERETIFDTAASEPSELSYAAFYADCLHEVRPVTAGHRVSLVFNLVLDSAGRGPGAPDYSHLAAPVARCLAASRDEGEASKIVWILDHEYSEEGLSFHTLKNTDAVLAKVLGEAADRADCELHAAVLKIEEYGTPDFEWGWDDDPDAVMGEVFDRWLVLDAWAGRDGGRPSLGEIRVDDGELLPFGALDDAEPDERRLEDSTGNEGPTLEHVYRRAALVVWPREKAVEIVAGAGIDHAVAWAAARHASRGAADSDSDRRILAQLVDLWPAEEEYWRKQDRGALLHLLAEAGAVDLAVKFLRRVVLAKYDGSENEALAEVMRQIGAEETDAFLVSLLEEQLPKRPACVVELLVLLGELADVTEDVAWREPLRTSVRAALTGLEAAVASRAKAHAERHARRFELPDAYWAPSRTPSWLDGDDDEEPQRQWVDDEAVRDLFLLARPLGLGHEAAAAAHAIGDRPKIVTPDRMLPAALEGMHEDEGLARSPVYSLLWNQAADFLLARSSGVPSEPGDWTMTVDISCNCEDCAGLRAFCRDPEKQIERFSVRKDRRKHLHRTIDGYGLDIDHVTQRRGSPYTLVCTKNRNGYKRRRREYAEDVRWMDSLRHGAPRGGAGNESRGKVARLEKAVTIGKTRGARAPG